MTVPDRLTVHSPMSATETRLGLEPIHVLLAERAALVDEVADLRAEYGSFGTFEHRRNAELARLAQRVRAERHRDNVKTTEAEVKDAAHSHPDYYDLVIEATNKRARLYRLEAKIDAIDQTIQRANAVARYLTSEARL